MPSPANSNASCGSSQPLLVNDEALAHSAALAAEGDRYCVAWSSGPAYTANPEEVPPDGDLNVLHEDGDIIVVEKPAFLPTENTKTIKDSVRSRLEASHGSGISFVHRLDWETSGLLVVARTTAAARHLNMQFAARTVAKAYVADVVGAPPGARGEVRLPLAPDELRRPRQCVDLGPQGKACRTAWKVLSELRGDGAARACRLRLEPETGRRHQLRMHCLCMGCAIAGDGLYTPPSSARGRPGRLHLHAAELSFTHPTSGERRTFTSAPPFGLEAGAADASGPGAPGNDS